MREGVLVIGNYHQTITVIRSLARAGYAVVVGRYERKAFTESSRFASGFWSHPSPSNGKNFIASLNDFLSRNREIGYVVPVGEEEIATLASLRARLNGAHRIVMAQPEVIERCLDKAKAYALAEEIRVPTPETYLVEDFADLKRRACDLGPPLVVKPLTSAELFLEEKAIICRSLDELDRWAPVLSRKPKPRILQRWVRGERHNCHFAAFSGRLLAYFQHKVLRTDRINETGYEVDGISVAPVPELRGYCESLIRNLGYTGVGCIQFLVDESSSRVAFMEINPRLDATCELPYRCGFDFPKIALQCADWADGVRSEQQLPVPENYPDGKRIYWLFGDLRALRRLMTLHGKFSAPVQTWLRKMAVSFLEANYHLTWSWSDLFPSLFLYSEACGAVFRKKRGPMAQPSSPTESPLRSADNLKALLRG